MDADAGRGGDAHLQVRGLLVERGGRAVLDLPELDIPAGRVTAVLGPNGAGKSTLFAALQLLVRPARGELLLGGVPMARDPVAARRRMAAVSQDPLLLSMSVRANVELPLRLRGAGRRERRAEAERWLARFGVAELAGRHARELSGGEAQRVNLARAFAARPEVLLLDEPFTGVDAPTRLGLIDSFAEILAGTRPTTVLITHDRDEALRLADRLAVIIGGRLRQWGRPAEVFSAPADAEVADFVGADNLWPAQLVSSRAGVSTYRTADFLVHAATENASERAYACIRPEQITLSPPTEGGPPTSARNHVLGDVRSAYPSGPLWRVTLDLRRPGAEMTLIADISRASYEEMALKPGDPVRATFKAAAVHIIPRGPLGAPDSARD